MIYPLTTDHILLCGWRFQPARDITLHKYSPEETFFTIFLVILKQQDNVQMVENWIRANNFLSLKGELISFSFINFSVCHAMQTSEALSYPSRGFLPLSFFTTKERALLPGAEVKS